MTAEIVASYVARNVISHADIAGLLTTVHESIAQLGTSETSATEPARDPAVPVKKSVTSNHIVCLECGRKFKTLKRHIMAVHGLSPDDYRSKWGLKRDYPLVTETYASRRSELAKQSGLGQRARSDEDDA